MSHLLNSFGEQAIQLYNQLSKMVPNFNPVLDESILSMYVSCLIQREQLKDHFYLC